MKKSRVFINTNLNSYLSFFLSFIKKDKYSFIFLNKLKKFLKNKNILLTSQGRVALYLIAKNLVSKKKNIFLTSPYTLNEALNSIKYAGGKIQFVDIDINTGLPKIDQVKSKINNQTCAILITHLYSSKKNIQKFIKTFKNQTIVEDTAINFGAKINNKYLGTMANYGFFSFGTMKNLCLFNGGLIYCKREKDLKKIKKLEEKFHNYPYFEFIKKVLLAAIIDLAYNKYIYAFFTNLILKFIYKNNIKSIIKIIYPGLFPRQHKYIPKNYKYKYQRLVSQNGINLLKNIKKDHIERVKKAKLYNNYLNREDLFQKFEFQNFYENSFLEYPILCKKNKKMKIVKLLFKKGFDVRYKWYIDNSKFFDKKTYKNSKNLDKNMLCLPTNNNFKLNDIRKICHIINNI